MEYIRIIMAETKIKNYNSLDGLLRCNKASKGGPCSHTRIPNIDLNIYAGSYNIPEVYVDKFNELYYKKVFTKNQQKEYLTEKQDRINGGPILVDIDLKFDPSVTERPWGANEISDLIGLYVDTLSEYFEFEVENVEEV